jgi:hypothetical protein
MKKHLLLLLLAVMAVAACEQEVYDKGDSTYSYVRADFVEAFVGSDQYVSYVITDDDERLTLKTPYTAKWIQRADTSYRAVLYYNIGTQPEVVSLARVSTVSIREARNFKTGIKTDPLGLESVWMAGNKKFLNFCVILKTGAVAADSITQTLGMAGDTIITDGQGRRTYHLRLFHAQGDVPQYYSQRAYFSVPVSGVEADSLQVSVNTYDGVVTKGFSL